MMVCGCQPRNAHLLMFFKNRILISTAAAWLAAVLAAAAIAVTATAASGGAALDDVQVGERGAMTRIALLCSAACNLETDASGEYILRGVSTSIDIDLRKRSKFVRSFATEASREGSRIKIVAAESVTRIDDKPCRVGGRDATCIDLYFDGPNLDEADAPPQHLVDAALPLISAAAPAAKPQIIKGAKPQIIKGAKPQTREEAKPAIIKEAKPQLREAAAERFAAFTDLRAPARFAPPSTAILANVTPIEPSIDIATPAVLSRDAGLSRHRRFDIEKDAGAILGKSLDPADCAAAKDTLREDAWALAAMVDLGFCHAILGEREKADGLFARLLEYTPDNYEALVGRALIAAEAGEKSAARAFFQDALNALPPIAESNRIVEAMAGL